MPYVLKEFTDAVNEISGRETCLPFKVYINNYSRKNASKKGDLEVYLSSETEDNVVKVKEELMKSCVQDKIEKVTINTSHLMIHFERRIVCENVINEILELKNNYGFQMCETKYIITNDVDSALTSDLKQLRQNLFNNQIKQLLKLCGCKSIGNEESCAEVSKINCRVGNVNVINSKLNTQEEIQRCCSNLILKSAEHKIEQFAAEDEKVPQTMHSSILDACIKFNLLFANPVKSILLDLDANNLNLIKSGSFVMYNYARLASLLHKFDKLLESGYYPPFSEINKLQYSLLKREEEWLLIRDFLMHFPLIVDEVLREINGQPSIHRFQHFLLSLSHKISAYYSKVRILMDPSEHLMPQIFVRVALLKAVLQIMSNCFQIIDIIPVTKM